MTTPTSVPTTSPATRPRRPHLAVAALAATVAMGLAACSSGDGEDDGGDDAVDAGASSPTTEPAPRGEAVAYEVTELEYTDVTAPAGATIEVANSSGAAHTFTAEDGSFDVAYAANEGATVEAPSEAGEYPFFCDIHPTMQATLTVG